MTETEPTSQNNDEMRLFVRQSVFPATAGDSVLLVLIAGRHGRTLMEPVIFTRFISCRELNGSCSAVTNLGREAGGQPSLGSGGAGVRTEVAAPD